MANKKQEKIIEMTDEEKKDYNIIEVESDPLHIKTFRLYWGDLYKSIKEFEKDFGELDKDHEIYYCRKTRFVYVVDKKVSNFNIKEKSK